MKSVGELERDTVVTTVMSNFGLYKAFDEIGIDYAKKEIRMERYVMPSKNRKEDLRTIERYFKDFKGRHPENFAIDPAFLEEGEK